MKLTVILLGFFLPVILWSCKKPEVQQEPRADTGGTRLTRVTTYEATRDSTGFLLFNYNSRGALHEVVDSIHALSDNRSYMDISLQHPVQYDAQQRFSHYFHRTRLGNDAIYDSLVYDTEGNVVKMITIDEYTHSSTVNVYRYDNLKRLVGDSIVKGVQQGQVAYTTFSYDMNGNMIESLTWAGATGQAVVVAKSEYTYGTALNPFSAFGKLLFFANGWVQSLSPNLVTREQHSNGVVQTYDATVFSNGFPATVTKKTLAAGKNSVRTLNYYYE